MTSNSHDPVVIAIEEGKRLSALRRYDILDTPPDGSFDRISALAADLFSVPIAIISLVDHDRIWFKSHHGLDVPQTGREPGLCASAVLQNEPWVINDARVDVRALTNPLVTGDLGLRFYLGIPLRTRDGFNLGTLCVIDQKPRPVTERQIAHLKHLASIVMDQMELRLSARQAISKLSSAVSEKEAARQRAELLAKETDHRVKNSLQLIAGLLRLQGHAVEDTAASAQLTLAAGRVAAVARVHQHLYSGDNVGIIDSNTYFKRLCNDLSGNLGEDQPVIYVAVANAALPTSQIIPLGLIVAELVANAAKYGAGCITVSLAPAPEGGWSLSVSDEGSGLPADFDPTTTTGFGMRVISALVRQLHGRLSFGDNIGQRASVTMWFPPAQDVKGAISVPFGLIAMSN